MVRLFGLRCNIVPILSCVDSGFRDVRAADAAPVQLMSELRVARRRSRTRNKKQMKKKKKQKKKEHEEAEEEERGEEPDKTCAVSIPPYNLVFLLDQPGRQERMPPFMNEPTAILLRIRGHVERRPERLRRKLCLGCGATSPRGSLQGVSSFLM